jgi:hypothetical protein
MFVYEHVDMLVGTRVWRGLCVVGKYGRRFTARQGMWWGIDNMATKRGTGKDRGLLWGEHDGTQRPGNALQDSLNGHCFHMHSCACTRTHT